MAFWNRKRTEIRAEPEVNLKESDPDTAAALIRSMLGGDDMTKEKALEIPSVCECIDYIAGTVASLPIRLYQRKDDRVREVSDDWRVRLLNQDTGDTLTARQFWRSILRDYYLGKGGYAYIHMENGMVRSLHYVEENRISFQTNNDPIFKDYNILCNGRSYYPFEWFKLLRNTPDGMRGKSIVEQNGCQLSVGYYTLKYENSLVKKGGNKKGFLQSTKHLSTDAMKALRSAFHKLYSTNEENVVVLNDGITFKESSNTSVEMQLEENKKLNDSEIRKVFGLDGDEKTRLRTIINLLSDIECSLNRDLLREDEKKDRYFSFDTKELTRGNIKDRFEAYSIALKSNFLQVDEVRSMEDWEPLGIDWVTLGLDSVLFDPKTKQIYTPNTNQTVTMAGRQMMKGGDENEGRTES